MTTLAQLRTAVRDEISEPTPGFWSNAEIDRWLNRANYDLADAAAVESSTSSTVTTVSGTASYALPTGFGQVQQVEFVDPSDATAFRLLQPFDISERIDQVGEPEGYYILGGLLFISPTPDAVYSIKLWYYKAGVTLALDADVPIIPSKYHDLLTLFAVSQAKRKADDPAYVTYLDDYVAGRNGMIEFLRNKGQGNRFGQVVQWDDR